MAAPLTDFVVSLNTDGYVVSQGSVTDALTEDSRLVEEMKHEEQAIELDEIEETVTKPAEDKKGKLVVAEEIVIGRVSWNACEHPPSPASVHMLLMIFIPVSLFVRGLGGKWPAFFWLQYLCGLGITEFFDILEMWWLALWARQYILRDPSSVPAQ